MTIEHHPFEPFLPANARILMLGSFPPPEKRWSIVFYYPNFTNDMWRIAGLVFFGDKNHFIERTDTGELRKRFNKQKIVDFCNRAGIAMYDTACKVVRLKDNASDKFLEVAEPSDITGLLREIPECRAVVTTGEKATDVLVEMFGCDKPGVGQCSRFRCETEPGVFRDMKLYRLPSSSRAYPLALEKKAGAYRKMFIETGVLNPHSECPTP